jgi:hypothetical protein
MPTATTSDPIRHSVGILAALKLAGALACDGSA